MDFEAICIEDVESALARMENPPMGTNLFWHETNKRFLSNLLEFLKAKKEGIERVQQLEYDRWCDDGGRVL